MHRETILSSLNSALSNLKNSIKAASNSNNDIDIVRSVWLASSELEYALFIFSLTHPYESETAPWKQNSQPKHAVEARFTMISAQELLKDAKNRVECGDTEKAYEETWTARNLLLKVQELFEKKRKAFASQTTRTR